MNYVGNLGVFKQVKYSCLFRDGLPKFYKFNHNKASPHLIKKCGLVLYSKIITII